MKDIKALFYRGDDWYVSAAQDGYWLRLVLENNTRIVIPISEALAFQIRDAFLTVEDKRHDLMVKAIKGEGE